MLAAGDRIGDYLIEVELGGGGMARVYRAMHAVLETHHAVKVLDPAVRANADARQRFLDEAKLQAKHLDHPNIVKVTGIVATSDVAALIMDLVDGPTLEAHLASLKAPPSPAEVRALMLPILAAVGHAHDKGVIHRDIKPANVLLARAGAGFVPKVADFGIAKVTQVPGQTGGAKKSTHADARMGTLSYMSPEQIRRAKEVTPRSDVFSLGALLYELATLKPAFPGDDDFAVMEKIVHGRQDPPEKALPGLDPGLAAVIRRALAVDPAARFASCQAMAAALTSASGAEQAASPVAVSAAAPGGRKVGTFVALAGAVVVASAVTYFVVRRPTGKAAPPAGGGVTVVTPAVDAALPVVIQTPPAIDVPTAPVDPPATPVLEPVPAAPTIDYGSALWLGDTKTKITDKVHFPSQQDVIKPVDLPIIDALAKRLADQPSMGLVINGYTDQLERYTTLGQKRADRVLEALVAKGVDRARLRAVNVRKWDTSMSFTPSRRVEFVAQRMYGGRKDEPVEPTPLFPTADPTPTPTPPPAATVNYQGAAWSDAEKPIRIPFHDNDTNLAPSVLTVLDGLAARLLANPKLGLRLTGYGSWIDIHPLTYAGARDRKMKDHLVAAGIDAARIETRAVSLDQATQHAYVTATVLELRPRTPADPRR